MKTAKQWVAEHSQSGAFDLVDTLLMAENLVQDIQMDAICSHALSQSGQTLDNLDVVWDSPLLRHFKHTQQSSL